MSLGHLIDKATDKNTFSTLKGYISFCSEYLSYIADTSHIQANIISQNEHHYHFLQYKKDGHFQVTRPFNSELLLHAGTFKRAAREFLKILKATRDISKDDKSARAILNNTTYTLQQSVGLALDGLPAGRSNTARKLNGALFEHLIRLVFQEMGIPCRSGITHLPVVVDRQPEFTMSYQHDLIVGDAPDIKLIGSVKTSSKDRLDKIFIDKHLYNRLAETAVPHIAIFLNDVQRKKAARENQYGITSTFLSGHFKGYTVKLNPLDGVYYCDIRPNMQTDTLLKSHIKTFDHLLLNDIWRFV